MDPSSFVPVAVPHDSIIGQREKITVVESFLGSMHGISRSHALRRNEGCVRILTQAEFRG